MGDLLGDLFQEVKEQLLSSETGVSFLSVFDD